MTDETLARFRRLRLQHKLNWSERRAAKEDLKRLIESLIEQKMVDPSERPLLIADMNRRLEQTSPRLWQKFCHWRRLHFGPGKWKRLFGLTENAPPLVSVIMSVYNGEKYVAAAIESILGQTFTDFEFIIVDDGSQDGSADVIRSYEARDDRIRLLRIKRNIGVADARNRAMTLTSAEYIAIMDSDDVCLPQRLERQVEHMRANPSIGVLGAGAQAVNEDLRPLYPFDLPEHHALIAFNVFVGSFLVHSTVMLRRELLESVGGYEPSRRTAIDTELWTRLMWRARFANLPEQLLLYRRHEAQIHTSRDATLLAHAWEVRARLLKRLWGVAPQATLRRFEQMQKDAKLGWRERRAAGQDMARLMDAMIDAGIISPLDRRLVTAHIRRLLEGTTPRLWQIFLHWRRHRFGSENSPKAS